MATKQAKINRTLAETLRECEREHLTVEDTEPRAFFGAIPTNRGPRLCGVGQETAVVLKKDRTLRLQKANWTEGI